MHRDLVDVKWLEIETATTKRHKFDGVMFSAMAQGKLATIIMEFAKTRCTDEKEAADIQKIYRNAHHSMNHIACRVQPPAVPRVFVVLAAKHHLKFEAL
ncbi:hypothetical protein DFQ29_005216, partial [Apophysomyces sp. BC1021]